MSLPLIFILFLLGCVGEDFAPDREVQNGQLDLSDLNILQKQTHKLDGQWEFFWRTRPEEINEDTESFLMPVPGIWHWDKDRNLDTNGYATYRTTIKLPDYQGMLAVYAPVVGDSYAFYLNGRRMQQAGEPSEDPELSKPGILPRVFFFTPDSDTLTLDILVANYNHVDPGIFYSVMIGRAEAMIDEQNRNYFIEFLLFGSLMIMGFYHLGLWAFMRRGLSPFYFGILCLLLALRTAVYGTYFILEFVPGISWEALELMGMLTFYLGPLFAYHFNLSLFPKDTNTYIVYGLDALGALFTLFALFTPYNVYGQLTTIYQFITLFGSSYLIYVLIKAIGKGRTGAVLFLTGFGILFITLVNDILHTNLVIQTFHAIPFGMLAFVVAQALVMTQNFAGAFTKVETLSTDLTRTNTALSRFVPREFLRFFPGKDITKVRLGDHVAREMAILFLDIRDFTPLSESMSPEQNFRFINSFLSRMGPIVRNYGGFVDKFLGDGILALFPEGVTPAVESTLEMQKELVEYNIERRRAGYRRIRIGVGIHVGELMLGTVGENQRMDYTVISDAVNLTSRLESLTKHYDSTLFISEQALVRLDEPDAYEMRFIGRLDVKGKKEMISVFDVFHGEPASIRRGKLNAKRNFEKGVSQYFSEEWEEAKKSFQDARRVYPLDRATEIFLDKIEDKLNLLEDTERKPVKT
jgi:adenylate cyclase